PPRKVDPAVPLDIHYLVTAGSPRNSTARDGLRRLGYAIQAIEAASPISLPAFFQDAIWLSMEPLSIDELSRIWGLFPSFNCRTCFVFRASPIWIDPLRVDAAAAPWQALLPARSAPAAPVLSERHVLAHLLLRSDRGFSGLGGGEGAAWAERLYGLSGELFAAMALEGTSELAVYAPGPNEQVPPMAVALHVRQKDAAVAALERLVANTQQKWGATREDFEYGGHRGACLGDLDLLPGLAPCYLATDRALVLGWNRLSVAVGLLSPPATQVPTASGLVVRLDRFPAADAFLRDAWRSGGGPAVRYPWSRLALRGSKAKGAYALELRLDPATPAGEAP
ncbi:MAG TPA: Pvc16 family protein, partial [Thermoanaerobaculia bacterium]|nr:Pvc16 family protein [Thermoanaerobaculia bacterium]